MTMKQILVFAFVAFFVSACSSHQNSSTPEPIQNPESLTPTISDNELIETFNSLDSQLLFDMAVHIAENAEENTANNKLVSALLLNAAAKGLGAAQNEVGYMYEHGGFGVSKDIGLALKWYHLAAQQGESYAAYNIGTFYRDGTHIDRDDKKATDYFKIASDHGNLNGTFEYGLRLRNGVGIAPDEEAGEIIIARSITLGFDFEKFFRSEIKYRDDLELKRAVQSLILQLVHKNPQVPDRKTWAKNTYELSNFIADECSGQASNNYQLANKIRSIVPINDRGKPSEYLDELSRQGFQNRSWCAPKLRLGLIRVASLLAYKPAYRVYSSYFRKGFGTEKDDAEAQYWLDRYNKK